MGTPPKKNLEKQTFSSGKEAREAQKLQVISKAFPKPVNWRNTQTCLQNSDESVHDDYNRLQVILKENSGLPSYVNSTPVT